jgi:hypothetical protein
MVVSSAGELDAALASLESTFAFGDAILYVVVALALAECLAANRLPAAQSGKR